ncbi:hypothetical protein [Chitinimonas lacunae]|uniref:CRISPR-associated nuclease/helicase Cas3 domain-containing protein n=1 Tax=Chitinimonas lacunae TaxID=1963018 RepID=A0ABV8MVL7_9NEIS
MDFSEFFSAVHGYPPFPWQVEAAERLDEIDCVTVPPGTGRSALLDAAVFQALQGRRRQIAVVVDRRLVLDQLFERALRIRQQLGEHPLLRGHDGHATPLKVVRCCHGMLDNDDEAFHPGQLTVLLATIDQLGSRLLCRPADFPGNDLRLLIDEAHLVQPLLETLCRLRRYGAEIQPILLGTRPARSGRHPLGLTAADHAHPVLGKRLAIGKPVRLVVSPSEAVHAEQEGREADFDQTVCDQALRFPRHCKAVGIVLNQVATARAVFDQLCAELAKRGQADEAILLLGRSRPFERDALLEEYLPRLQANRNRTQDGPRLYVVTTQAIEVGADLDFDALVSESARLSALRQRLGQLDRCGDFEDAQAVIVHRNASSPDPIYGASLHECWAWLARVQIDQQVDFGVEALEALMARQPPPDEPAEPAPLLTPTHLQLLQRTGPDTPLSAIDPYLHGISYRSDEVNLLWRRDFDEVEVEDWPALLQQQPPSAAEALPLPCRTVLDWLAQQAGGPLSDLTLHRREQSLPCPAPGTLREAMIWRGVDKVLPLSTTRLLAGDTVVVPASYGGCDRFGWHPGSATPVLDIAELGVGGLPRRPRLAESKTEGPYTAHQVQADQPALLVTSI